MGELTSWLACMSKNESLSQRVFALSCAFFDSQGCLVDWNKDFESEFAAVATYLLAGTPFRDILQRAYEQDQIIRVGLPQTAGAEAAQQYIRKWPADLEINNVFKYWDGECVIDVSENRTISRGIIRLARPKTQEADAIAKVSAEQESANTLDDRQERLLRTAALETANSILMLRMRAEQQLKTLSMTDQLTGLANRRQFMDILQAKWQRALYSKTPIGIAMIDVDNFKKYNDHYGHPAGDTCLRQIAEALNGSIRQGMDLAARYGGEEFAFILPDADLSMAWQAAERARLAVAAIELPHLENKNGIVTISIGVASLVPIPGNSAEQLIELADAALYQAKQQGRNRVVSDQT